MIHSMGLAEPDFLKVLAGTKTLELRLYNKKRASINIGDYIWFKSRGYSSQKVTCEVQSIHRGATFLELFNTQLNTRHAGFESTDVLIKNVRRFYSEADENVFGVICFGIKLTKIK